MQSNKERAKELVPALILTLLSMIQALALELFWSRVEASGYLWQWNWEAAIGWLQVLVVLEGILLIWVLYVSFVLRFSWLPSLEDTLLPFAIGLLEFALIDLTAPHLVGPWMLVLAVIFALALVGTRATLLRAERDPANAYFFAHHTMNKDWRTYIHTGSSIIGLTLIGLGIWLFDPAPWIHTLALVAAFGAVAFQYLQARAYWLHSLVENEPGDKG